MCNMYQTLLNWLIIVYCLFQIRLVVEEGLNQLPYKHCEITTPTGEYKVNKESILFVPIEMEKDVCTAL